MIVFKTLAAVQAAFEDRSAQNDNKGKVTVSTSNVTAKVRYTNNHFSVVVTANTIDDNGYGEVQIWAGNLNDPVLSFRKGFDDISTLDYRKDIERPLRTLLDLYGEHFE